MSYNLTKDVQKLPFMTSSLKKPTPESAYLHGLSSGQLITAVHKLCLTGAIDSQKCDMENVTNFLKFSIFFGLVGGGLPVFFQHSRIVLEHFGKNGGGASGGRGEGSGGLY